MALRGEGQDALLPAGRMPAAVSQDSTLVRSLLVFQFTFGETEAQKMEVTA